MNRSLQTKVSKTRPIAGVFNIIKFIRIMREKRGTNGHRICARQIGISHMAYYNIEQGRVVPTLESFIRIVNWMDSDAQLFVICSNHNSCRIGRK